MRRKPLALALAATAVVATWVAPASGATSDAAATAPAPLTWGPCPGTNPPKQLQCGTLKVPLDYRDPEGGQIEIAVSRLPSRNPAQRRGALLTNPGGPGGSGLGYPLGLGAGLPQQVLDTYDLIGMDPRGVGRSTPVTCDLTPAQLKRGAYPAYAHGPADVAREARYARGIAEQCAASDSAWMLPHTTTANTARDMDRIRAAIGEPKISYLGASYGTQLGATYAQLFPERGDRIVLDSVLGPRGYDVTAFRLLARGMEDRFPDFAAYASAHPEYGLGTTPAEVESTYAALARRLDAEPQGNITGTLFRGLTLELLYSDTQLPELAKMWQTLKAGKPYPFEPTPDQENSAASRLHVLCADSRWPLHQLAYQRNVAVDRARYPQLGASTANITPCAFWPSEHREPPVRIGDRGPSNILLVQNERDPGTPLAGALKLRQALGQRARMVTADQGGHGVYPFGTNTCANEATTTFLTTGKRPAADLRCAAG
ncbi:hydrolase [Streptomyces globisporus C-1027]|uniref:Hydrolase n=1 Tax=Streptomyces globisporus C-1027 TaxID=1172567 RepID=A0A0U3LTY3_STRGL|nr:alpha/beta hydrolase [Streptomyces globisporus]ALU95545.1 hydrolase [Streptomyces globisporus C-1027]